MNPVVILIIGVSLNWRGRDFHFQGVSENPINA